MAPWAAGRCPSPEGDARGGRGGEFVAGEAFFCLSSVFAKAQCPALGSDVSALPDSHMMSEQMSGLLATADIIEIHNCPKTDSTRVN